ncbi:amidophosphoribosyltransferase, partial [Stenotrophomonas maltophilia]
MPVLFKSTRLLQAALRVLLPLRCLVCGDPGDDDLDLCRACLAGLPWAGRACLR